MRKIYISLMTALALSLPGRAQTIFQTSFSTQEEFNQWVYIDANKDGSTWTFSESNEEGQRCYYNYNSVNDGDDWLISPAITPDADGPLLIRYHYKGGFYGEAMKVYSGTDATAAAMTTLLANHTDILGEDYGNYIVVDGKAGKAFRIGFYACSGANKFRLYLKDFSVEKSDNLVDLALTEIISPVTGEGLSSGETVTVKISNPGFDPVSGFSVSFAVDGETVATEPVERTINPGEETTYTFTAKADLSTPRKVYSVSATVIHPDDIEITNNTATVSVKHQAVATAPYFTGFEPDEDNSGITFFNLNKDTGDWGLEVGSMWLNLARTGYGCLGYNYDKNNNADDWAILEPISVDAGYYVLKFWYSGDDRHPEKLAVYWGNEAKPQSMTNKIVEYAPFARGAYEESINILHFETAQTVYIGFYAFSDKDENWITVDDVSFERIESSDIDIVATKIISPFDYMPIKSPHNVTFTVKNVGIEAQSVSATVFIDDAVVHTEPLNLDAQEERYIEFSGLLNDIAAGEHSIKIDVTCAGDINPENNSIEKTFRILGAPDIAYDFEDGKIPDGFTFRAEDEGTLAPGAVSEFGETGWAIISIGDHPFFGTKMLGASSWIEGVSEIDRWCVLPKVLVTADDACFTWNAGPMNPDFIESYEIKASEIDDSGWYDTLESVLIEETGRPYRGVSLAKYKNKEIFVAIRMRSSNGDAISFDNLELYGCQNVKSGIEDVSADENSNTPVEFFNLQGQRIEKPAPGQFVIRRQGGNVTKVIVR